MSSDLFCFCLLTLFVLQAGIYIADRPRLVPLPAADVECAVHAVCPWGHLKIATAGFAANTAVAILSKAKGYYICHALLADVPLRVRCSAVGVSYPVLITYNTGSSTMSVRYRLCTFASSRAFDTNEFSVLGYK